MLLPALGLWSIEPVTLILCLELSRSYVLSFYCQQFWSLKTQWTQFMLPNIVASLVGDIWIVCKFTSGNIWGLYVQVVLYRDRIGQSTDTEHLEYCFLETTIMFIQGTFCAFNWSGKWSASAIYLNFVLIGVSALINCVVVDLSRTSCWITKRQAASANLSLFLCLSNLQLFYKYYS